MKPLKNWKRREHQVVAPRTGAWIETMTYPSNIPR